MVRIGNIIRASVVGIAIVAAGSGSALADEAKKVRIGWQKGVFNEAIVKAQGTLEGALKARGIEVQWIEFQVGPPMMEALNVGSLDIAAAANTPPIFAQAAGADFVYIGSESPTPGDQQILVAKSSPIRKAADLRGKKVAIPKGSMAHYAVIKYLEDNGMQFTDIQPLYLSPADCRAALEGGSADAWAAFDPLMAGAEIAGTVRVLVDGFAMKVNNRQMYFARREFAEKNPQLIADLLDEIAKTVKYVDANVKEAAQRYASVVGLDAATFEVVLKRNKVDRIISPLDPEIVKEQQTIADTFYRLKLMPKQVDVKQTVWKPSGK